MTKEYIGREEKCGDCIHVEICERNPILTEFSRENPAYCKKIMKAADVATVRHGRWIQPHWKNSNYCCNCSECGREAMHADYQWDKKGIYPLCPYCGAIMDKEGYENH